MGYTHYFDKARGMRAGPWSEAFGACLRVLRASSLVTVREVNIEVIKDEDQYHSEIRRHLHLQAPMPSAGEAQRDPLSVAIFEAQGRAFRDAIIASMPKRRWRGIHVEGSESGGRMETFAIPRYVSLLRPSEYVKTDENPCDLIVVACLCLLAEAGLRVESDGEPWEWEAGRSFAQEVLGRPVRIPDGVVCKACRGSGAFPRQAKDFWKRCYPDAVPGAPCPRCRSKGARKVA